MTGRLGSKLAYRIAADLALGFFFFITVFAALAGTARLTHLASTSAHAGLIEIVHSSDASDRPQLAEPAAAIRTTRSQQAREDYNPLQAIAILGGVFASLFALNVAFFRHLRNVYARPRRSNRQAIP